MNTFIHKIIRKSDNFNNLDESFESKLEQFPTKSSWMKKLHTPSQGKRSSPASSVTHSPTTPIKEDMQDLAVILRDFETGYLSPRRTNQESSNKGGKFVKRMVAALEQKFSECKEPKTKKNEAKYKRNSLNAAGEFQIRRSYLNETYIIQPRCKSFERLPYGPDSVPDFFADGERADITNYTFEIDEGTPKVELTYKRFDEVLGKEEISSFNESLEKPFPMKKHKPPKIVGAFLKKPIEVEETEIHWIPIRNQKLPRESSFKKLLSILTGKKRTNKNKKSNNENDLNKEPRDHHRDSGYDDKSSSSSSLSSKVSFDDVLINHDTHVADVHSNERVSTFQPTFEANNNNKNNNDNINKLKEDVYANQQSQLAKKLILDEVSRSDVRLSLGPFFPAKEKVINSSNEKITTEQNSQEKIYSNGNREMNQSFSIHPLPKHPFVSPLPKHPFVSNHSIFKEHHNSIMSIEEFSQIDLRHMPSWKFPSTEIIYDTPRNHLSISTPDLILRHHKDFNDSNEYSNDTIYDIPRSHNPGRPKSCIYEDALSLKRRTECMEPFAINHFNFYTCPDEEQYATVKPRNIKILPSQQLLRSMAENETNQLRAPYLVNSFSQSTAVF